MAERIQNPQKKSGQGAVEFALMLPILIFIAFGALELGRAFFAYIAITNAAREGARVFTFRPDVTLLSDIYEAINFEIADAPLLDVGNIASREVRCNTTYTLVGNDTDLKNLCTSEHPIRVTVTYNHTLIFESVFPQTLTLRRSTEMMVP
jgi:Flp pilus assembly protein TadG